MNMTDGRKSVGAIIRDSRGGLKGAIFMPSPCFVSVLATNGA